MSDPDRLRVQVRETIRADGTVLEERLAFCHEVGRWVAIARCQSCAECTHVLGGAEPVLICRVMPVQSRPPQDSIRSLLARSVWCIEAGAPARLACIMPMAQADAIVVDIDGHAIGLLSRDTARRARGDIVARLAMEPTVVALFDGASVEQADELMSKRGVRTLPILSAGRVIGCVEADYGQRDAAPD